MLNDIKAKLPFKKKGNSEALDENEDSDNDIGDATDPGMNAVDKTSATDIGKLGDDEGEDKVKSQTLVDKIKAKLIPKKKSSADDDEDDDTHAGAGKKPVKKKINPVVLVVVIVGLAIFVLYEEEPEPVAAPVVARKSLRTKPKPVEPQAGTETPVVTDTPVTATEPKPDEPAVVDATTPTETPTDAAATEPTTEPNTDEPAVVDTTTPTETPTDATTTIEPTTDEPTVVDSPTDKEPISTDSIDGQVTDTDSDDSNMTDKILEDLEKQVKKDQPKEVKKEYVVPPDYEYKGRGLVYNCAGKHWACVDGPSYKTCEDNFSSTSFQKKNIECYPFNVYDNKKGCELMQNRVVSSNAKTAFCKGN